MINQKKIAAILKKYDPSNITIGVLGGHSALDVCHGAKRYGFKTVVVCQKGREKTYSEYYKTRKIGSDGCCEGGSCGGEGFGTPSIGCVDEVIIVDKFKDIVKKQKELQERNTIFIHNRYFWVYCDFKEIENDFMVPIFGNRIAVRLEERDQPKNQYYLLEKAGIRTPKIFKSYKEIDRLAIIKVNEATRGYERAFFMASTPENCLASAKKLEAQGVIKWSDFEKATIEEYALGPYVNLNFFYSPLTKSLELMGTDARRQTNLDGFLRLPADRQLEVLEHVQPKMIESGHYSVTMKESLVEKAYDLGEKFVKVMAKEVAPGMIGPFALQGAVVAEEGREEFVIFDVSMRIPGSPGTKFTPYSGYLYGESLSYGERIAMEIREALFQKKLELLVT